MTSTTALTVACRAIGVAFLAMAAYTVGSTIGMWVLPKLADAVRQRPANDSEFQMQMMLMAIAQGAVQVGIGLVLWNGAPAIARRAEGLDNPAAADTFE
jgi:hypothetical protein